MKFGKSKIICGLIIIITTFFLFLWLKPIDVGAWWWDDDTKSAAEFLRKHSDWLQFGSFFPFIMHEIGWVFVTGLYIITSFLEGLLPESLSLLKFLDDSGMQGIIKAIVNDLIVVLMVLTIVFLGFKTMIAKEPPNLKNVGVNIFISSFLIVGLPTLMDTMQDVSVKFFKATQTDVNDTSSSLSWNLIKENTADLVYVADNGFDLISNNAEGKVKNGLKPDIFTSINMSEVITPDAIDDLSTKSEELDYLKYTLSSDGQGNYTATKINGGFLSFFSDNFKTGYFRYPANFTPMLVGLLALAVAYFFTIFIFITTIIEIGIKRVVGLFVFATDLESGQRTKMVVQDILNAFLLIAFTGLSFRMYTIFLSFLASSDVNMIIYIIALISATFVLIKGSNTIMRYFGIDVGLKEGFGQMAAAFALGKATTGGFNKLKNVGKSKNNINNSDSFDNNQNKDMLDNQGDIDRISINDSNKQNGKINNGINGLGKSYGYMADRGLRGMAQDVIKGSGELISNNVKDTGKSISDNVKGIKESWNEGIQEGSNIGQNNRDKWTSGNQSLNELDKDSNHSLESPNDNDGLNHSEEGIKAGDALNGRSNVVSNGNNPTLNESTGAGGIKQANEQILTDIKLSEGISNSKDQEISGNLKLDPHIDGKGQNNVPLRQEIVQGNNEVAAGGTRPLRQKIEQGNNEVAAGSTSPLRQEIEQGNNEVAAGSTSPLRQEIEQGNNEVAAGSTKPLRQEIEQGNNNVAAGSTTPLRQEVEQGNFKAGPGGAASSLKLDVDSRSLGNPIEAKQSIIQQVEKASIGSNDAKQRIIQEAEKSTMATPQQMQQNVQQVLASARLPQEAQQTVQKVFQELQSNSSQSVETLKSKVIQELESTSLGAKEPIKQMILQDVQKAFSATPEQVQQNIKQVIQNVKSSGVATPKQIQQNVQQVFKSANLPNGTQDVVQKIIQESGPSAAPEALKSKVIQEIEKASFENNQLKQTVIQDIQKAFSPTPEQLEQNINQVFTKTGANETSQGNLVNNVSAEEKSGYFGSLFGEKVNNVGNTNKVRKSSRFDFIKNVVDLKGEC
ncbi:pLS20_p028 family conjugation system transmembrane protein [Peribacillus aracenensis]|uniref:pLS20_p028 family conjugation system transmembrane protein n=1 Tax=Peribacillus aracenensis TaxID=2976708 RepID=UPI0021A82CC2|nr:hypothetical protein [Peribacillus sp. BBB004]